MNRESPFIRCIILSDKFQCTFCLSRFGEAEQEDRIKLFVTAAEPIVQKIGFFLIVESNCFRYTEYQNSGLVYNIGHLLLIHF